MDNARLKWLGHGTFRLTSPEGRSILVDPWLAGNPTCPAAEHVQAGLDAILLTHGHDDHVADLIATAAANPGAPVVAVLEAVWALAGLGLAEENAIGMNLGGTVAVGGFSVSMVEARHTTSLRVGGRIENAGIPVGYVVGLEDGRSVYFAGDTALFGDMTLIGELYRPHLAVLPIGGHFTMDGRHAARAARMLGCEYVVPCHYRTFPLLAQDASALLQGLGGAAKPTVLELEPGQEIDLPPKRRFD